MHTLLMRANPALIALSGIPRISSTHKTIVLRGRYDIQKLNKRWIVFDVINSEIFTVTSASIIQSDGSDSLLV